MNLWSLLCLVLVFVIIGFFAYGILNGSNVIEKTNNKFRIVFCVALVFVIILFEGYNLLLHFTASAVSKFNSNNLSVVFLENGEIEVHCDLETKEPFMYAWYIYDSNDKSTPIEKIMYTEESILKYTIPDGKSYSIKCFVRNSKSGEQKSVWVPDEELTKD